MGSSKHRHIVSLAIAISFACADAAAAMKTVVVISIDGLGAHLLATSKAPNIKALGENAPLAETVFPAQTIPAHVSMLTGVSPDRHAMLENEHSDKLSKVTLPTIFDLVHAKGLRTAAVLGKEKLKYVFDDGSIDEIYMTEWPLLGDWVSRTESFVYEATVRLLKKKPAPNLLFVHFALVDTMGHAFKWGSLIQRWSVQKIDSAVSRIMKSIEKNLEPGTYAVILTSDHGGHDGSHGQTADGKLIDRENDQLIPWIIHGAKLKKNLNVVRVFDTAPTVAALLGLEVPSEWRWEGRSVVEVPVSESK